MTNINIIGIGIIGVFLLFIFMKRKKRLSDYLLIVVNLFLAVFLYSDVLIRKEINAPLFIIQNLITVYLFSAFLTYAMLLISGKQRLRRSWWWIYIYSIAFTIFIGLDFFVFTDYDTNLLQERYLQPTLGYHFFYKTHSVYVIVSLIWFLKQLEKYQSGIKHFYSLIEPLQLTWLKNFTYVFILINIISLITFLIYNIGWIEEIQNAYLIINSVLVLSILYLSYNGIRQYSLGEMISDENDIKKRYQKQEMNGLVKDDLLDEKYKNSGLSDIKKAEIFKRLNEVFREEELYKSPNLKIQTVADHLQVSIHHLSQTINTKTGKPFYDFVNKFRVELLKEELENSDNQKFTILALALDCGFNSKASLNRIFKQYTGVSPSQYQKSHLIK